MDDDTLVRRTFYAHHGIEHVGDHVVMQAGVRMAGDPSGVRRVVRGIIEEALDLFDKYLEFEVEEAQRKTFTPAEAVYYMMTVVEAIVDTPGGAPMGSLGQVRRFVISLDGVLAEVEWCVHPHTPEHHHQVETFNRLDFVQYVSEVTED